MRVAPTVLLLCAGCTSTVYPPVLPAGSRPVSVYVITDACHQGLILPAGGDAWVEYGFGELEWFAYNNASLMRVENTLLYPSAACLVRAEFRAMGESGVLARYRSLPVFRLDVSGWRARLLLAELTGQFDAGRDEECYNPLWKLRCVPVSDSTYSAFHNCGDVMADWLTRLGCRVSWVVVRTGVQPAG